MTAISSSPLRKVFAFVLCLLLAAVTLAVAWQAINLFRRPGLVYRVPLGTSITELEKYLPHVRPIPTSVALLSESEVGLKYADAELDTFGKRYTLVERLPYVMWVSAGRSPSSDAIHIKFNYRSAPWEIVFCDLYYINGRLVSRGEILI